LLISAQRTRIIMGSGWRAELEYEKMEIEARAKPLEEREEWEVRYLESIDEMNRLEASNSHWIWNTFWMILLLSFLGPGVYIIYQLLQL